MDLGILLGYFGCACAVGIPAIGSSIGAGIAGAASHGVMAKVDEGHGKFIGISAAPSSQTIYGIVLMFVLLGKVDTGAGLAILGIGLFCGLAICISAIYQGKVCASGILASSKKPAIFGKCFAAVGITESFAILTMVFGLVIAQSIH